uniref:Uncharacterized protein n=1 Tax=Anguilla anguilla TaxID=7936 RepID=A0A0E9WNQ1_ANGAN
MRDDDSHRKHFLPCSKTEVSSRSKKQFTSLHFPFLVNPRNRNKQTTQKLYRKRSSI